MSQSTPVKLAQYLVEGLHCASVGVEHDSPSIKKLAPTKRSCNAMLLGNDCFGSWLRPCLPAGDEEGLAPLTAAQLANQAVLAARKHVEQYYDGYLRSDDELHAVQTRNVALRWDTTANVVLESTHQVLLPRFLLASNHLQRTQGAHNCFKNGLGTCKAATRCLLTSTPLSADCAPRQNPSR